MTGLTFFGPDLGPNFLQRLSADNTFCESLYLYNNRFCWVKLMFFGNGKVKKQHVQIDCWSEKKMVPIIE